MFDITSILDIAGTALFVIAVMFFVGELCCGLYRAHS